MHANVNVGLYESRLIYILYFWNILYKSIIAVELYELYIIINYKLYNFIVVKLLYDIIIFNVIFKKSNFI